MPASSKTEALTVSYAVSIAHFSPRSLACCRWCTRTRAEEVPPYSTDSLMCHSSLALVEHMSARLCPWMTSQARSSCSFADRGQGLPPPIGDGQPPITSERLQADLGPGGGLPALELGCVHQSEDPRDGLGVVPALEQLGQAEVAVDVVG